MLMTRLIKNSMFVSRRSERLQSLGGAGSLPVIECGPAELLLRERVAPSSGSRRTGASIEQGRGAIGSLSKTI